MAQSSFSGDWVGFQGNAGHTGASTVVAPPAYQPLWVARPDPVPKQGKATSVVFDGKQIISDISPATIPNCLAEDEYAVVAYDPSDGSQKWRTPTRGKLVGSPHVSDDRVYAMVWDCPPTGNFAESSTLLAIDSSNGEVAWRVTLAGIEAGPPVLASGLVLVPGRARKALLAYDALTGEMHWEAPLLDSSRHSIEAPAVLDHTVFAVDDGHLYALDINSGAQRWRVDTDGKGQRLLRFHGSPIAADGMVMVIAQSDLPPPSARSRFSLEAYDAATGDFRSGITLAENDWANVNWGVSYSAGRAFISGAWLDPSGKFQRGIIAFDLATSTEAWRAALGSAVYPPAIDSAGRLLVTGELGSAWLLDAETGAIRWTSRETHRATTWLNQKENGEPYPGMPGRDEWLPNRWGIDVDGSAVLLDSIGAPGGLPPVLAGNLTFGHTGKAAPYLVAFGADTTPPSAQIRRPAGGYVTLTNEFVLGTAYDYNLASWKLEYGSGPEPQSWITLKEDSRPRQGNSYLMDGLASWKAGRLGSGVWMLRLVVTDTAGQTSTTTTQLNNDLNPPTIKIEWPVEGMTLDSADLIVRGSASDDFELKQVKVAVPGGGTMLPAEGTQEWTFAYTVTNRDAGDWITIEATAEDMNGHTARDQVRVRMAPLRVQVSDLGRRLTSNYPIFVSPTLGQDHDGLLDAWENEAISLTEAVIVMDEEEDWLRNRTTEPVAQFARVRPYVPGAYSSDLYQEAPISQERDLNANPPPYIVFQYVLRWAKDYGRFGIEGHDIDTEKYFMAWRVLDSRNLELAYVFTSSHRSPNAHHSVWHAWDATCNVTDVANLWNEAEWEFEEYDHSEVLCGGLEFQQDGRLVLYASEDKHAIYPTEAICESVTLTENVGPNAGEDCGWQPSASPISDSHWNDGDFGSDPRYLKGGRWLLDVVNAGDDPYILVGEGEILGLAVPVGTLENSDENPPQILRRAMAALYRVEIQTGDRNILAGINRIDLRLVGSRATGELEIFPITQPPRGAVFAGNFMRGSTDVLYGIEQDLGEISRIEAEIRASGLFRAQALRIDSVRVTSIETGQSWTFPGAGWMPGSPDGTISMLTGGAAPLDVRYRVSVLTGDRRNAGTDAKVTINLIGADGGTTGPLELDVPGRNDFERGQLDVFTISSPVNISELATVTVDQDNGGDGPGWYAREIRVKNLAIGREWVFYPERWLADDEPGGRSAILPPAADCGVASYRIKVLTSGIDKAGTDADVFVNLLGEGDCQTGEILLDSAGNDFEAGHADTYMVRAPNVTSLGRLLLRHDNSGDDAGWHVSSIVVENLTMNWKQVFNPNVWLEGDRLCWASTDTCP